MKYLVLLIVLVIAYNYWRHTRIQDRSEERRDDAGRRSGAPQEMVQCAVCSVHLPRGDAVAGSRGTFYCSQEHRLRGES
jgi:uncharacterized protein